jgi:hypothetical protein
VLGRGPTCGDCAVRWHRDYIAYYGRGNKALDKEFQIAQASEPIGPIYAQSSSMPTSYPNFVRGIEDMSYFLEPMNCTMYWIEGAAMVRHTTI